MILDDFAVTDEVAIVTGAGLGIGRSIAIGLAEAGADVVVAARTTSDLAQVVARIEETCWRALAVQADVMKSDLVERTPMQRAGTPDDIACAALYLASPASSWVTGAILNVDGGSSVPAIQLPVPALEPRTSR